MSAILKFQTPNQTDPNTIVGYLPPKREWIEFGRCACEQCRYHKPRKCPSIVKHDMELQDKNSHPKPIKIITLWVSREMK